MSLTVGAALAVSYGLNFRQAPAVGLAAPVVSYSLVARRGWETINAVTGSTCSTWATWLFGGFSVLVLGHLVAETDWGRVFGQPTGPTPLMITGVGLIAAGGISRAPSASYSP